MAIGTDIINNPTGAYYDINNEGFIYTLHSIIVDSITHIANTMYTKDATEAERLQRFIESQIDEGENVVLGDYKQFIQRLGQFQLPFTAFYIGERTKKEETYTKGSNVRGQYVSDDLQCTVTAFPITQRINMLSFFGNAMDYNIAYNKIEALKNTSNKRDVILNLVRTIDGTTTTHQLCIRYTLFFDEFEPGALANQVEEYLRINNLWNISHSMSLHFNVFECDTELSITVEAQANLFKGINVSSDFFTAIYRQPTT